MRRHRALLITGLALVLVGALGVVTTLLYVNESVRLLRDDDRAGWRMPRDSEQPGSLGEQIFLSGRGADGPIEVLWEPIRMHPDGRGRRYIGPARLGCARCHGRDGRGGSIGMMGGVAAADIRYSTLTSPHEEDGEEMPAWTDEQIAEAVRDGVEPDGTELNGVMPRWRMSEAEMDATIEYLKELDER